MSLSLKQGKSEILINKVLKNELLKTKDKINQYYNANITQGNYGYFGEHSRKWNVYRSLLNKYENIGSTAKKDGKISRAYYKLKEIIIDDLSKFTKLKRVATLAEGPGGFIKFISDYYPKAEIFGITLKYGNEDLAKSRHFKEFEGKNIQIIYGEEGNDQHDGNLYNPEVVNAFASRIGKVDLVTADGGFEATDENNKEIEHVKLFLAETLTAFKVLNKGGSFILKIYDIFTRPTLELLFLLGLSFKSVELKKPVTSRPANSERYVVCHGFKGSKITKHVGVDDGEYESILDMTQAEKKKFEKFIYNLGEKNESFVKNIIENISDVVNFISVNENNRSEINKKLAEQKIFTNTWKKVYEKQDRKEKRKQKRERKKEKKDNQDEFKRRMEEAINKNKK